MMLFVCAQDLQFFWIGLIKNSIFVALEKCPVQPEGYLKEIDQLLRAHALAASELDGLCVVTGPGSFTSSRVSLTIANTIHFVHKIPFFILENPDHLEPNELLEKNGMGSQVNSTDFAHPFYDRPAHITQPRGDKRLD